MMMLPPVWKKGIEHEHDVAIALKKGTDKKIDAVILLQKKGNIFKDGQWCSLMSIVKLYNLPC
jgi:hypothetical protein